MELLYRLRAWSHARQRLSDPADTLPEALRSVVAVYATHPTCPLALAARTRGLTSDAYRQLDADPTGLRIPAMRRTLFLVPRENAGRVFSAVRLTDAQVLSDLKREHISAAEYARLAERILAACEEPVFATRLRDVTGIDNPRLGRVLRCLRYEGRLLALAGRGLLMSPHRYVATSAWAADGLDAPDPSNALAWLAGEYLRAYGPARVADFAWWAGVPKGRATAAVDAHDTVTLDDGLLLLAEDEAPFGRVKRLRGTVDLLPRWDGYTMGHAPDGRTRFVHPDLQERVYTPVGVGRPGDGNPVVLVDGQVVGLWSYSRKDGARLDSFDALGPTVSRKIAAKLEAVTNLLS